MVRPDWSRWRFNAPIMLTRLRLATRLFEIFEIPKSVMALKGGFKSTFKPFADEARERLRSALGEHRKSTSEMLCT